MLFLYLTIYLGLCSIAYSANNKYTKSYLFAVFVPLGIFMGFRSLNMGVDTRSYYTIFEYAKNTSWGALGVYYGSIEIGYLYINKFFSIFSDNYYHFQILYSIVYCLGWAIFIKRAKPDNVVLLFALFLGLDLYFQAWNISRQMFAVMIGAYCFPIFSGKKNILSIAIILLLSLIHTSSLLYILILLYNRVPRSYLKYMPLFLILFVLFFNYTMTLSSLFFEKYEKFYDNNLEHDFKLGISIYLYIFIFVLSILSFISNKKSEEKKRNAFFSLFSIICIFLGLKMNYMERVGLLFIPFTLLTLIDLCSNIKDSNARGVYKWSLIVIMLLFFYLRTPSNYSTF